MKKIFSKPLTIGRFSISIVYNEILLLYRGGNKIIIKKISVFSKPAAKAAIWVCACVLCLALLFVLKPIIPVATPSIEVKAETDDEVKHRILSARDTEYSDPVESARKIEIKTHRVKQGETISKIARMYGVSMETICGSNNLNSFDLVAVGSVLKIPAKDGIVYQVKKNEQLASVAKRFHVSVEKIVAANDIRNVDFIQPEQYLFIPDAKPQNLVRGFVWPTLQKHAITSGYGWRNHPIFNEVYFHKGLDIYCNYGWVRAAKFGKVTYTGWLGGYGRTVIISHPGGWKTLYGHLSRISVRNGQYVKQGQFIAKGGNTGNSTGPHLHFEIIGNGDYKNPRKLIK